MKNHIPICTAIAILFSSYALAGTLKTLDAPGATQTSAYGIDGDKVVGSYTYGGLTLGFVYDGTNWTTLRKGTSNFTVALDIDGDNILAQYQDGQGTHNAIFNGITWTTIPGPYFPPDTWWQPKSISGDNVVGTYKLGAQNISEIYNIKAGTWQVINPQAGSNQAEGMDGDNVVGVNMTVEHYSIYHYHGFLYNSSTSAWTTLDVPGATRTEAYAVDGSNIVGLYQSGTNYYTFLYDGSTWRTLDRTILPSDMDGDNLVGSYTDASGSHGFIYTIPEPATLLLLGFGAAIATRRQNAKKMKKEKRR
jgi:hypothetical protein